MCDWKIISSRACGLGQCTWYGSGDSLKFSLPHEIIIPKYNPAWSIHSDLVLVLRKDHNDFACIILLAVELILYSYSITLLKRVEVMGIYVISLGYPSIALMKTCLMMLCCSYPFRMWLVDNWLWRKEFLKWIDQYLA